MSATGAFELSKRWHHLHFLRVAEGQDCYVTAHLPNRMAKNPVTLVTHLDVSEMGKPPKKNTRFKDAIKMVKKTAKRWDLQKCGYHVCTLEGQAVRWLLAAFLDPALSKESTKMQAQNHKNQPPNHTHPNPQFFGLFSQHPKHL